MGIRGGYIDCITMPFDQKISKGGVEEQDLSERYRVSPPPPPPLAAALIAERESPGVAANKV